MFRKISEYIRRPWRNKKAKLIRGIQVDLSRVRWMGCAESAWLSLALDHIGRRVGGPIGLILPTDMRANAFLNRWKFLDTPAFSSGAVLIDTRSLSRYEASAGQYATVPGMSSRLVEYKTVRIQPLQGVPSQDLPFTSLLVRIEFVLQKYVGWKNRKELIHIFCDIFLRELLTNVFEHSDVDYGLIAIQFHQGIHENSASDSLDWEKAFVAENPNYVELFVGDNGVGIENSLGSVYARADPSGTPDDILLFACQKGTTSKPLDK
ncbi:MAG TPA: hypothetical protein VJ723_12015, partial [Candidatus Angelobacter sp.]|nr:hypothetical protein [Candidatus Angelobacter sp.]